MSIHRLQRHDDQLPDSPLHIDDLLVREGCVALPYGGTEAGAGRTGLRLGAVGRLVGGSDGDAGTIWRIVNSSLRVRQVTLYGPRVDGRSDASFRRSYALQPRSELLVVSPVIDWPATHLLSEDQRLIDVCSASTVAYVDPRRGAGRHPASLSGHG